MEDKTICTYCGKKFANVKARASHQNNCPAYKKIREEQELEWKQTKHYCSICGKEITKFKRYGNALETCDSKECIKQALSRQRSEKAKKEWQSQEYRDKIKATSQEKYGTDSPLQSEAVKDKIKSTNLERYEVESLLSLKEFHEDAKQVMTERYGADNPMKVKEFQEKAKQTNLERYGVEYTFQSEDVKDKIRQTNLERYGVDYPAKIEMIKDKVKATNLERYGVEAPLQSEEVWKTYKENYLKNHGVEHPSQDKEARERKWNTVRNKYFEKFKELLRANNLLPLFNKDYYTSYPRKKEYKYKCLTCKHVFITELSKQMKIQCPYCKDSFRSRHEKEVYDFIKSLGVKEIEVNRRFLYMQDSKFPKEIDIYLPEYKFGIEVDGLYWHSDKPENWHLEKTLACEKQGITLIHITDSEWDDKQEICKSIISGYLGKHDKIYARDCEIREVGHKEGNLFCLANHIQGTVPFRTGIGLYYQDKLVQIATFGKSRFNSSETELLRSCSVLNTNIVGGLSKLIKAYIRGYSPENLITYCDRRLFTGKGYLATEWELVSETKPNYWYFSLEEYYSHSRIKFQKHKLQKLLLEYYPDLTEKENMELNGWLRFYDCGSLKFRFTSLQADKAHQA